MAVVNLKSSVITNRDASPRTLNQPFLDGAGATRKRAINTITNGDSAASTYRFFSVPSRAVVSSLPISAPDIGTTTTMDLGLYQTTQNGGAVVDADFFTAARILNAGAIQRVESVGGNILSPANGEKRIWEALGLTADPGIDYDVVGTLVGAADGGGAVLLEIEYVQ